MPVDGEDPGKVKELGWKGRPGAKAVSEGVGRPGGWGEHQGRGGAEWWGAQGAGAFTRWRRVQERPGAPGRWQSAPLTLRGGCEDSSSA